MRFLEYPVQEGFLPLPGFSDDVENAPSARSFACNERKQTGQYSLLPTVPYEIVSLFSPPAIKNAVNNPGVRQCPRYCCAFSAYNFDNINFNI